MTEKETSVSLKPKEPIRNIDIVIPTHNNLGITIRCLEALYKNTKIAFHLIVIDDSVDLTPLYLNQFSKDHDNVTYIHNDNLYRNGNQILNIGFKHARHDFIASITNSVSVEPEWELGALQIMSADPKIGIVGCKCLLPNGFIESAGIQMHHYLPCDVGRDLPGHRLSITYEAPAVQWAFALLRKEAVLGLLDDSIFYGFRGWDDIDNCFELRKAGWKVFYCGSGVGYHEPRATRGDDSKQADIENRHNGQLFYKRWGFWDEFIKQHPDGDVHAVPIEGKAQRA